MWRHVRPTCHPLRVGRTNRPIDFRSRAQDWRNTIAASIEVQGQYAAWVGVSAMGRIRWFRQTDPDTAALDWRTTFDPTHDRTLGGTARKTVPPAVTAR